MWSSPTVSSGCVYVGGYDDKFYCLNATTGIQIWNYTTGNEIFSSPAVASGYVYFGSKDDNCYCLNASTGGLVWNYLTGASIYENSPALALGCIYIGSGDGYLYCFKQGSITSAPVLDAITPNPTSYGNVTLRMGTRDRSNFL